jgi:ABC-2 type transport system permease protein
VWQALWAIALKELIQSVRTTQALKRLFTMQVLNFLMLANIDATVRELPTVIVDRDHTVESRVFVDRLAATHTFQIAYSTSSVEQARGHVKAGRAKVAIVIPPDYARTLAAGGDAEILALVDGSDSTSSSQAVAVINGIVARINLEVQDTEGDDLPTVTPHNVLMFNPEGRTVSFMLPGFLAITLGLGFTGIAMRRIVAERAAGNIDRLLMTPLPTTGLIFGKILPYFAIGCLNAAIFLLVIRFGFQVPIRGSLLILTVGTMLYVLTVLTLGAFIAAGAQTIGEANSLYYIVTFPAVMLSGYIFPLSALPKVLLPVSYAMPQTHFIELMRGVCLRGADAKELAPDLLYLVIAPIVLSIAASVRFERSVVR